MVNNDSGQKKRIPIWVRILADTVLIGVTLVTFAYFHHVRKSILASEGTVISGNTETAETA
jgi:hypothetical protein